MRATWFEQLATQALAMKPYPDPRFPPSPYYRFLRLLASNLHPSLSVELGLGGGGGSFHLAFGWPHGTVVGVDVSNEYANNLEFLRQNCDNFHFRRDDSIRSAPYIYDDFGAIDILFVDTTHTYQQTMDEWQAYRPYLSDRSVVCFDDLFRPGMDRAWAELPEPKCRLDRLHIGAENGGGFGVVFR